MKISRINTGNWGKVRAFFDLTTQDGFTIKGFKLIEGINGLFVSMPSQKGNDEEYYDTVYAEKILREELTQIAIDYYGQEVMPTIDVMADQPKTEEKSNSEIDQPTETITDDDIPF